MPALARRVPLLLGAALVPVPAAHGQADAPTPTFEAVISLRAAGSPALSPDGRSVAFTVRTTDWKENRYDTEIWLAREDGEPVQLTRTSKGSSGSPQWSPDGKWLAFLADRGEKQQVYVLSLAGGEAMAATNAKEGVGGFAWSPDGRQLAYTARDPQPDAMKARKDSLGDFAPEDEDWVPSHLWLITANPEAWARGDLPEATRLTEGTAYTVGSFDWSPDGTRIAFDHRRDPLINSWPTTDISIVTVASREVRALVTDPGADGGPQWSPDGRWVLYTSSGSDTASSYYRNNVLLKIPSEGGRAMRLALDFDENISPVGWTPRGIYFAAWVRTERQLYQVNPETGATRRVEGASPRIGAVSFSRDGNRMAYIGASASTLPEVYVTALDQVAPRAVTAMTAQTEGWPLGTAEVVSWTSRDGTRIEGVLHKPNDFDPRRRYPLFVVIHGGPTGVDSPDIRTGGAYPVLQWVARGALVLRPNYRGSAGYGAAFRRLNVRNLGVGDMWDVMAGVDHLIRQGIVDTTRMGAMGWSQGGYISAFLTTNTTRFKAISVGAGISNWVTYYVATDIHPFTRQYLQATPWEDADIYRRTSPMTTIQEAATPTLIQHGEFDRRVPIQNAYELYQGLQDQGVPTRLIVYKGFGHGITKPKEQRAALEHNWAWFNTYVWGTPASTSEETSHREPR